MIQRNVIQAGELKNSSRPLTRTRKFSTLHMEIFEQMLISSKTNRALNIQFGYTRGSHALVDRARKVMHKLLTLESLKPSEYKKQIVYPREYKFWWANLLNKHKKEMLAKAVKAEYY